MQDYKHRLLALARQDRQPIKAEIPATSGDGAVAKIRLYDPIDSWGEYWGVSAKEFAEVLDSLPESVNEIRLHINSPGGEVFEAIAITNLLRDHPARVVATVDGVAASAASFIAAAADELIMAPNSELMIHDAWELCVGNAQDMRQMADDLDRISDNIASIYATKADGDVGVWRDVMRSESWFSATEAVEVGLADLLDDDAKGAKNRFDLSIFTYAGRDKAPAPDLAPVMDATASDSAADEATVDDAAADDEELLALVARSYERLAHI